MSDFRNYKFKITRKSFLTFLEGSRTPKMAFKHCFLHFNFDSLLFFAFLLFPHFSYSLLLGIRCFPTGWSLSSSPSWEGHAPKCASQHYSRRRGRSGRLRRLPSCRRRLLGLAGGRSAVSEELRPSFSVKRAIATKKMKGQ